MTGRLPVVIVTVCFLVHIQWERHSLCVSFLKVRKCSEGPIQSPLLSYWPELGHMFISELITNKRYGIILIPLSPILDLRGGSASLKDVGYVDVCVC